MYSTAMYVGNHRILLDQLFILLHKKIDTSVILQTFIIIFFKYIITHFIEYSLCVEIYLYSTLFVPTWLYVISTT